MNDSPVPSPSRRAPLRKIAILAGFAVDIAGSIISTWGVIVAAVTIASIQSGGNNPRNLMAVWATDRIYTLTMMVVGMVWSVVGGFVAAKIAGREHVRHAAITGVASTVLALFYAELQYVEAGLTSWWVVIGYLMAIPSAAAGGYLARLRATAGKPGDYRLATRQD